MLVYSVGATTLNSTLGLMAVYGGVLYYCLEYSLDSGAETKQLLLLVLQLSLFLSGAVIIYQAHIAF